MNNKRSSAPSHSSTPLDLAAAVEAFVAQGGVIAVIPTGASAEPSLPLNTETPPSSEPDKLELLKLLVAKGAGVSSLQYSLKMNRKGIRKLAQQHGIKINFSRPLKAPAPLVHDTTTDVDVLAGHAMHYASLGYSAPEIAHALGLSIRQVVNIGKVYRFDFRHGLEDETN